MSTISHEPPARLPVVRGWAAQVTEMWASLAIAVIWLAVLVTAVAGPDIVTIDASGTNSTVPAAVAVALFAAIATWPVAKYGFAQRRTTTD